MDKLEKSIRHALKYYGPDIRNGHWGVTSYTVGVMPSRGFIKGAYCDLENGIVTDIRLYAVGDAQEARDYYGESVCITEPIEEYITDHNDWDMLINEIYNLIEKEVQAQT